MKNPIKETGGIIADLVRLSLRYNVPRASGALAFFLLMSFFPLLMCANAVLGIFHVDVQHLITSIDRFLPQQAAELVREYVEYLGQGQSEAMLTAGIIAVVISASAGLRVLLDTMDEMYDNRSHGGWRNFIVSIVFSLLFLVTLYLSVFVILTGDWFLNLLGDLLPRELISMWNYPAFSELWGKLRYVLLFCFVILLVMLVYRLGTPKSEVRKGPLLVCALLSSIALVLSSAVFSWFIGLSSRYSLLYGSLASIVILMLWLYICGTILLLGTVLNRAWNLRYPLK